jgi:hypothetical protein
LSPEGVDHILDGDRVGGEAPPVKLDRLHPVTALTQRRRDEIPTEAVTQIPCTSTTLPMTAA